MYAVVSTGGKQYRVAKDDVVVIEKLDAAVGETVNFDVMFLSDEDTVAIDPAQLESASVTAEILEHFKGDKVMIFKFKKRKGYKRTRGHRQVLTRVRITDVVAGEPAKKKAAPRKKKAEVDETPVDEPVVAAEAVETAEAAE